MGDETRIAKATEFAEKIGRLANELDSAISDASYLGYHTALSIEAPVSLETGKFKGVVKLQGHGEKRITIRGATVVFDLLKAVR